ncbi:alpha-ketoglutarate-dependent dioxygenase AlkB [Lyngbya aestuarii]|uniref:alpha-ketoglutarate-dependent dioxygenase AlkB n=1 Tax=Lyngbya aestuarii TaxID=118322 RepID=UPI00403D91BE
MTFPANKKQWDLGIDLESDAQTIPGLTYIPQYLNADQQIRFINIVNQQEWSIKAERRIQNYGYRYDYEQGVFVSSSYLGTLPDWAEELANKLVSDRLMPVVPDQVIVNEYQPGQGIPRHRDCIPCFGATVSFLSLESPCIMEFTHIQTQQKAEIMLVPGSLVLLEKEARYDWQHGIIARKIDIYKGRKLARKKRLSLTFREVLFPHK